MQPIAQILARVLRIDDLGAHALMIVGMHRSGTSFLTGSLQQAGLELGRHSAWNPHNIRGNRENPDFVEFHERLLAARSRAWHDPPEGAVRWTAGERAAARELMAAYKGVPLWGFKDPRALLFVDGWLQLMPRARFVGIFRHPAAVARSLAARGGMPTAQALSLWLHYNRRLLELHRARDFPLLCFDESEEALHARLDAVLVSLGLQAPGEHRFWSAELRHHEGAAEALPDSTAALYRELRQRSERQARGAGYRP